MKKLTEILKREHLFRQYQVQLINIVTGAVEVQSAPKTLLVSELLKNLIFYGFCVVANPYRNGSKLPIAVLDKATIGGVTEYSDIAEFSIYANPINDSRTYYYRSLNNEQDCVIIRSNQTYTRWISIINKYALLLADCDITTDMSIIALRTNNVLCGSATDSTQINSIKDFFKNLINGQISHIMSNDFMSEVKSFDLKGNKDDMISTTVVKNNILRQFLREIGIGMGKDKSQAILSDELESDLQILNVNQSNLIEWIQKGLDEASEVFGIDKMTVSIKESYRIFGTEKQEESEVVVDEDENMGTNELVDE